MSIQYDANKLFKTVIMTEEKVSDIYQKLADKVTDAKAKALFTKMAEDERQHKIMYTSILGRLPFGGNIELTEDEAEYTDLLISTNIFVDENNKERFTKMSALSQAEKIEKDSILFYSQILKLFPNTATNEIEAILNQEKKHLKIVLDSQFLNTIPFMGF